MEQLISLTIIMILAMLTPGPDMLLLMTTTWKEGVRQGYQTALGITAGLAIHLSLSLLGVALLVKTNLVIFTTLQLLGALYIAWLGSSLIVMQSTSLKNPEEVKTSTNGPFWRGFLCNVLNPKVTLFILGLFTFYLTKNNRLENIVWSLVLLLECLVVWLLFVKLMDRPPIVQFFTRHERTLNRMVGSAFCLIAGKIIWTVMRKMV